MALDCANGEAFGTQGLAAHNALRWWRKRSAQGTKSASGAGTKASMSGMWDVVSSCPRACVTPGEGEKRFARGVQERGSKVRTVHETKSP